MKGSKNIYNCQKCGNTITTIDKDQGVTPMMIQCSNYNGCESGFMFSLMYNNVPSFLVPGYQWIKNGDQEPLNLEKITSIKENRKEAKK